MAKSINVPPPDLTRIDVRNGGTFPLKRIAADRPWHLKTLLHTRALIPDTTQSTASRRGTGPMPSNLVLTAEKGLPADQLKAELFRQTKLRGKEFGIVVRRMGNPQLDVSLNRSRVIMGGANTPGSIRVEPLT